MKKLFLATASLVVMASSAFAADLPRTRVVQPVVAAPAGFNWTGVYVGAQVGYAWSNARFDDGGIFNRDGKGLIGGLHLGYNWHNGSNVVFGVEGDVNYSDVSGSFNDTTINMVSATKMDWSGSARLRLGYAANNFMPFITGGVAFGNVQHSFTDTAAAPVAVDSYKSTRVGWTVGAGLEYAFDRNWSSRIEYRYTDFGSASFTSVNVIGDHTMRFNMHDVKAGISYRF